MAETRWVNDRWGEMARELIGDDPALGVVRGSEARIAYLSSDANKKAHGKPVLGQCELVQPKMKWAVPFDFTVTLYENNVAGLDEERLRRVVFHELLHIGVDLDDDGNERYSIVPHDLEDFAECVDRWGRGWERS